MEFKFLIFSFLAVLVGIVFLYAGFVSFQRRKLIENTPTSKIRSLAMGFVEVYGLIIPYGKNILKGPFSQKDCVFYKYVIERYQTNGKGNGSWRTVQKGSEGVSFVLKDASGSVLVDPSGAEVDAPQTVALRSAFGVDPARHVQGFLKKKNISFEGLLGANHQMRYTEYALFPNQNVYVMGTAGDNPFVAEGKMQKNEEDIMIQKGHSYYYISPKSEKEVLQSFVWKIVSGIGIGTFLFLGGLIGIFLYYGVL